MWNQYIRLEFERNIGFVRNRFDPEGLEAQPYTYLLICFVQVLDLVVPELELSGELFLDLRESPDLLLVSLDVLLNWEYGLL